MVMFVNRISEQIEPSDFEQFSRKEINIMALDDDSDGNGFTPGENFDAFDGPRDPFAARPGKRARGTRKPFPWLLFMLIGCGVPAIFIAIGGWFIWQDHVAATRWLPVKAGIVEVRVAEGEDSEGDTLYTTVADYEYEMGGAVHRGTHKSISTSSRSAREEEAAELGAAGFIELRVNPENHAESVIPGRNVWFFYIFLGAGVFFLLVFGGAGLHGMNSARREERAR